MFSLPELETNKNYWIRIPVGVGAFLSLDLALEKKYNPVYLLLSQIAFQDLALSPHASPKGDSITMVTPDWMKEAATPNSVLVVDSYSNASKESQNIIKEFIAKRNEKYSIEAPVVFVDSSTPDAWLASRVQVIDWTKDVTTQVDGLSFEL